MFLAGDDDVLKLTWLQGWPALASGVSMPESWGAALEVDPYAGGTGLVPNLRVSAFKPQVIASVFHDFNFNISLVYKLYDPTNQFKGYVYSLVYNFCVHGLLSLSLHP